MTLWEFRDEEQRLVFFADGSEMHSVAYDDLKPYAKAACLAAEGDLALHIIDDCDEIILSINDNAVWLFLRYISDVIYRMGLDS